LYDFWINQKKRNIGVLNPNTAMYFLQKLKNAFFSEKRQLLAQKIDGNRRKQ
jgi:hypothetical protein